jgi:hypothetical protein
VHGRQSHYIHFVTHLAILLLKLTNSKEAVNTHRQINGSPINDIPRRRHVISTQPVIKLHNVENCTAGVELSRWVTHPTRAIHGLFSEFKLTYIRYIWHLSILAHLTFPVGVLGVPMTGDVSSPTFPVGVLGVPMTWNSSSLSALGCAMW